MATLSLKKRTTLSLKKDGKTPKASVVVEKKTSKELEVEQRKIRNGNAKACRKWLMSTFPFLFDPKNPKPLALGIIKDIKKAHAECGGVDALGFGSHLSVSRVLHRWTRDHRYLKALCQEGAVRFNLLGEPVGPVSDDHIKEAQEALASMKTNKND